MIGIWLELDGLEKLNFSDMEYGNPGCGGVEYLSLLLIDLLSKNNINVIAYSRCSIKWVEQRAIMSCANTISEAIYKFDKEYLNGQFILKASYISSIKNISSIKSTHFYLWHHNFVDKKYIHYLKSEKVTNIFLTKYQCKLYWRQPAILRNSVIIPNANVGCYQYTFRKMDNNVVFVGSIVPGKNLHLLLKEWPNVIRKINANLFIVGSGNLYCRDIKLGENQIAEEQYEKLLFDLIDKNGIRKSIHFLGIKNAKQIAEEIVPITKVAVVNPGTDSSHYPETFCLSATQLGSFGIPVVGGNQGGLKYTLPKKCGYRINDSSELSNKIIELLKNNKKNIRYGNNYQKYIKKHFDISLFEQKWIMLLQGRKVKHTSVLAMLPYIIYKYFLLYFKKIIVRTKKCIKKQNNRK